MQITSSIITLIAITSLILPISNNLISLGSTLIINTLLATTLSALIINSWYSFIIFLVLITGLLVLFSYIIAISPNTSYNQKNSTINTIIVTSIAIVPLTNTNLNPINGENTFENDIQQLFSQSNTLIYWTIGTILLLALLIAVTLCYNTANPLRNYI